MEGQNIYKKLTSACYGAFTSVSILKVHIPPLTKFRPETPYGGQKNTCKKFPESELWFSHN